MKLEEVMKNAVDCIDQKEMQEELQGNRPLRIKLGMDPTSPDLHLGHAVVLEKLRQFQENGHIILFVIGDFTAMIGDPSGRNKVRKALSIEEIRQNAQTYVSQVSKILDVSKAEIRYNSEWLSKITMEEMIRFMSHFTLSQILERDDFHKRFTQEIPIFFHEFMYPFMQAYDSVAIHADVELGGTDQTFNLLLGRELQDFYHQPKQCILTMPLLVGLDGQAKMSKSLGNYVGIMEDHITMYGKMMSIPDHLIADYFQLVLGYAGEALTNVKSALQRENPMDWKMRLARETTEKYHNQMLSNAAETHFVNVHRKHDLPEEMPVFESNSAREVKVVDFLLESGLVNSKNDGRRLIEQNGLEINGHKITDIKASVMLGEGMIWKAGKRKFLKISVQGS